MNLKDLEISKEEFYSFARFIEESRGYAKYWSQIFYKSKYGKNPERNIKDVPPREPPSIFLEYVDECIEQWYQQEVKGTDKDWRKPQEAALVLTQCQRNKLDSVRKQLEELKQGNSNV